jgi:phosphoglycerate kinase
MNLPSIENIGEVKDKKVILRLDLNVPVEEGLVKDDYRIRRSMKTVNFLREKGAKVIIISHIESAGNDSLLPVSKYMGIPLVDMHVDGFSDANLSFMNSGDAVILENLRKDPGEKENNFIFAKKIASLGDIFVNEAFSVSHRNHASIIKLPEMMPSFFGFLFMEEVQTLSRSFNPSHPFVFILGGAKFETKLPLVKKFLNIADKIFICGALANSFYKERGMEIGRSRADDVNLGLVSLLDSNKVEVPEDAIVSSSACMDVKEVSKLEKGDLMVDAGPQFRDRLEKAVLSAKFVLWNGPLGIIEDGFSEATRELAKTIAISDAVSVIGGGDTISAIKGLNIEERVSFISTGGGAMLDFLANGTLPGIDAVLKSA